jgi:hypothetical protein
MKMQKMCCSIVQCTATLNLDHRQSTWLAVIPLPKFKLVNIPSPKLANIPLPNLYNKDYLT